MSSPQPARPKKRQHSLQQINQYLIQRSSRGMPGAGNPTPNPNAPQLAQQATVPTGGLANVIGVPTPNPPKPPRQRRGLQQGGAGPQNRRTQRAIMGAVQQGLIAPGPNAGGAPPKQPPIYINVPPAPRNPQLDKAQQQAAQASTKSVTRQNVQAAANTIGQFGASTAGVNKTVVIAVVTIGSFGLLKSYLLKESPGPVLLGSLGLLIFLSLFDLVAPLRPIINGIAVLAIVVVFLNDVPAVITTVGNLQGSNSQNNPAPTIGRH